MVVTVVALEERDVGIVTGLYVVTPLDGHGAHS